MAAATRPASLGFDAAAVPRAPPVTHDAIIVGAGVIGVAIAEALSRQGLRVLVIDQRSAAGQGASFANGGQLSYSYTDALASPGLLKRLPAMLLGRDPAFRLRLRADPDYLRWCLAFLRNGSAGAFSRNSLAGLELALRSRELMAELLGRHPIEFAHQVPGKLLLHEDPAGFRAAAANAERKAGAGIDVRALTPAEAVAIEPALDGRSARLAGAIFSPGDAVGDAHLFCSRLLERLAGRGVEARFGTEVTRIEAGDLPALLLASGERLQARQMLICAGPQAAGLLRTIGWRVPIQPVRGHSLTLPLGMAAPRVSITDVARKLVFCRLSDRLRIAGLADVGFDTDEVDPARLALLHREARKSLPQAADYGSPVGGWAGLRPVTPDSLPIVERRGAITINVGHGGLGWTYALATAERAAGLALQAT